MKKTIACESCGARFTVTLHDDDMIPTFCVCCGQAIPIDMDIEQHNRWGDDQDDEFR